MSVQKRRCATCKFFQNANMSSNGWCTHPKRQTSTDVKILVRKGELACRNAWGEDFWLNANAPTADGEIAPLEPPFIPPAATATDDQVTFFTSQPTSGDDVIVEHTSRYSDEVRDAVRPRPLNEKDDLRSTNAAAHDDQAIRVIDIAKGDRNAIVKARERLVQRRMNDIQIEPAIQEPQEEDEAIIAGAPNGSLSGKPDIRPDVELNRMRQFFKTGAQQSDESSSAEPGSYSPTYDRVIQRAQEIKATSASGGIISNRVAERASTSQADTNRPTLGIHRRAVQEQEAEAAPLTYEPTLTPEETYLAYVDDDDKDLDFSAFGSMDTSVPSETADDFNDDFDYVPTDDEVLDTTFTNLDVIEPRHPAPRRPIANGRQVRAEAPFRGRFRDSQTLAAVRSEILEADDPTPSQSEFQSSKSPAQSSRPAGLSTRIPAWQGPLNRNDRSTKPVNPAQNSSPVATERLPRDSSASVSPRPAKATRKPVVEMTDTRDLDLFPAEPAESTTDFDIREYISSKSDFIDMRVQLAPDVPRMCRTCRDFRPSESGERGWCTNDWAFNHRQMVNADDLPCNSSIGCWWLPVDRSWLPPLDQTAGQDATPRTDRLLGRHVHAVDEEEEYLYVREI